MSLYECKLILHRKCKGNEEDILFSAKDFPTIKAGSLLEIYQLDNEKHNLVKIESVNVAYQQKDSISMDLQLATSLRLIQNKLVKFKVINESIVTLDVLDIIFKDQYMSRSDMYRFTHSMKSSVLQVNKKLEFVPYRGHVGDMWCRGQRISCGYVGDNTRVVFRSATSVFHIFIQMSQEMWEFDYFGELYFDKAINFISDLFIRWNDNNCGHDVTIVLFSRLFYKNISEEHIPGKMKKNIKKDYKGRMYEDFYYIVVQNERYVLAEWRKVVKNLKLCFNQYKSDLEQFKQKNFVSETPIETELSTAEDANFLETLNMALNLYETYYVDRNFDRTGKICVVITAGPGVYNVDRVQTHLTKQRICDLGVGMDLVCMGEQPLHAVPLFIFHQKNSPIIHDNQYYIPYWINHSFYRSVNELQAIQLGKFIPRIRVKIEKMSENEKHMKMINNRDTDISNGDLSVSSKNFVRNITKSECTQCGSANNLSHDNDSGLSTSNKCDRSGMFTSFFESVTSKDDSCIRPVKSCSKRTKPADNPKALFNPFAPNRFNIRTTLNSRRWSHVFPIDKKNKPIQLHHQLVINSQNQSRLQSKRSKNMAEAWKNYYKCFERDNKGSCSESVDSCSSPAATTQESSQFVSPKALFYEPEEIVTTATDNIGSDKTSDTSAIVSPLPSSYQGTGSQKYFPPSSSNKGSINRKVHTLFTEGEQKWSWDSPKEDESPINHMGVDWKSLILPAILPITSDHYPTAKDLEDDFLEYNYQLMANSLDHNGDNSQNSRRPLGINEVFRELVLQRLNQGFQLIVDPPSFTSSNAINRDHSKKTKSKKKNVVYRFGLGRIYHSIEMKQDLINVTQYSPRHPINVEDIHYNYCMKMTDSSEYMMFRTKFSIQMLEKFNWNYHDHYILNYGGNANEDSAAEDQRYKLIPSLKFWRSRFYLLPVHSATKTIMDVEKGTKFRCDIYDEKNILAQNGLVDDFFKFLEVINKIKRRVPNSKTKKALVQMNSAVEYSPNVFHITAMSKVKSASSNLLDLKFTFDSTESVMKPLTPCDCDRLTDASPIPKILDAMTNTQTGMTFLPSSDFPNEYTFTSFECVNWCRRNIDNITDVKTAVAYLQKLMNLKYIIHATECPSHRFVHGFMFYCLNESVKKLNNCWQDSTDVSMSSATSSSLSNLVTDEAETPYKRRNIEWVEVSLASLEVDGKAESEWCSDISGRKLSGFYLSGEFPRQTESIQAVEFLMPKIPKRILTNCFTRRNIVGITGNCHDPDMLYEDNGVLYKKVVLDVENDKDDRPEWGIFQFHANYHPTMAFEFMIQWLVATGGKLAEKVSQWTRKISNFQLIAVPCDPFALPSSINSDPLRGPIFVPLKVHCLLKSRDNVHPSTKSIAETIDELFGEFPVSGRLHRLMLMQESILKRFGFIKESCVSYTTRDQFQLDRHTPVSETNGLSEQGHNVSGRTLKWSYVHYSGGMFAMIPNYNMAATDVMVHDALYTQTSVPILDDEEWDAPNIGFLWSWNKMLTRKSNPASLVVDEQFQDRMLADFKDFCNNRDERLQRFLDDARLIIGKYFEHTQ